MNIKTFLIHYNFCIKMGLVHNPYLNVSRFLSKYFFLILQHCFAMYVKAGISHSFIKAIAASEKVLKLECNIQFRLK